MNIILKNTLWNVTATSTIHGWFFVLWSNMNTSQYAVHKITVVNTFFMFSLLHLALYFFFQMSWLFSLVYVFIKKDAQIYILVAIYIHFIFALPKLMKIQIQNKRPTLRFSLFLIWTISRNFSRSVNSCVFCCDTLFLSDSINSLKRYKHIYNIGYNKNTQINTCKMMKIKCFLLL